MAVAKKVKEYLDKNKIKYEKKKHAEAYTAQEIAHAQHVSGKMVAKSVVVKVDSKMVLFVMPSNLVIDMPKLKKMTGAKDLRLATEKEFADLFPDCEIGAMSPFGNIYNIPVCVDKSLIMDEYIVFNAGTHKDTIKMKYKDFEKLVNPKIAPFAKLAVA